MTFGKEKKKSIDKVKYFKQEELIKVSMKEEVEQAIIEEKIGYFRLAYILLLLEGDSYEDVSMLNKGKLI